METNAFLEQYTSQNEISKYTRATAGSGINYLLDHDYKAVYLEAVGLLPQLKPPAARLRPIFEGRIYAALNSTLPKMKV